MAEQFRKKPVVIEAMQWDSTVEGATRVIDWVLAGGGTARFHDDKSVPWFIAIDTLEGTMVGLSNDWNHPRRAGRVLPVQARHFRIDLRPGFSMTGTSPVESQQRVVSEALASLEKHRSWS